MIVSKKIKIAIIGGSFDSTISKTHLRSILASNKYEIVCGCFSRNKNNNKENIKNYYLPENKIYNDVNKLLESEKNNIDLAVVLTPPNERYKIYYKLAKKNIGIIAEKPFEGNLIKAKKVYKFLKKKDIFFVTTYNYLGYPAVMEIKNLIKKIGRITNLILEMPQQASTLRGNSIKKWRTKDLSIPNLHLDLASHLLSIIIYFFNQLPHEVNSFEMKNLNKSYIDNSYTWLKFKTFIGHLWYSKNATGKKNELTIQIYGKKGSLHWEHKNCEEIIQYDNKGNKTIISRLSKNTQYLNNKKLFTYSAGHPSGFLDAFINIYENIYNLYQRKTHLPILINLKDNLDILSVLETMHSSSNKKLWKKVFLEK
jgi:predicted dehydrogenase